jgi:hypothetical protein
MKHLLLILVSSVIAISGDLAVAAGNSNWATIVQINVSSDILIKTNESPMFDPDFCNGGNPPDFYAVAAANTAQNKILATALTAQIDASKQVRFFISGCIGNRPKAASVQIK